MGQKAKACLARARNAKPSVHQKSIRAPVALAMTVQDLFLTSEIFSPCFGKGSLLQFAEVTVVLENGYSLSEPYGRFALGLNLDPARLPCMPRGYPHLAGTSSLSQRLRHVPSLRLPHIEL